MQSAWVASRSSGRGGSNEPVSLSGCSKRVRSHVLSCWSCMVGGWLVGLLGTKRLSRPMCATMPPELSGRSRVASHIACEMKAKVASKSLPDVRHRGHRNADRNQNRSDDHAGIGTEIACQCAPPWPSISKPKSKSHQKTSCADRFGEVVSNLISVPKSTRNRPEIS